MYKYHPTLPGKVLGNARDWGGLSPPTSPCACAQSKCPVYGTVAAGGAAGWGCACPPLRVSRETVTTGSALATAPGACGHGPGASSGTWQGEGRGTERLSDLPLATQPVRGRCSAWFRSPKLWPRLGSAAYLAPPQPPGHVNAVGTEWPAVEEPRGCQEESGPTNTLGVAVGCGHSLCPPSKGLLPSYQHSSPSWYHPPRCILPSPSSRPMTQGPSGLRARPSGPPALPWPGAPSFPAHLTSMIPHPCSRSLLMAPASTIKS